MPTVRLIFCLFVAAGSVLVGIHSADGDSATDETESPYVEDRACGSCHYDLYQSYRKVGMARSFTRPRREVFIEDFDAKPYFHTPSGRYYEMRRRGERLIFTRYQLDRDGKRINQFEREVDWIVGSGNKTRSYLYQTEAGELYQLPIGWYSEIRAWRMAPGYDRPDHDGVLRPIRRECMFCHNAYPDVPAGTDASWRPHTFPSTLPEGTGCQRCHGPGARHIDTVLGGGAEIEEIRKSIVNPGRLSPERRDSVCFQCHLLPSVELIGVRRFGRDDYSFRPGELLSDYLVHVDPRSSETPREERFEINHHAYRLLQSECFRKSDGALSCITCHDPHRKVPPEERVAHYGGICLGCHERHDVEPDAAIAEPDDCMSCHMPQRRTQDVVHVVMTDHKIQKSSGSNDLLAPLEEHEPDIVGIDFLMPDEAPAGALGEIYKAATVVRAIAAPNAVDHLESQIAKARPKEPDPYFDLARAQILLQRFEDAERTLDHLAETHPSDTRVLQWRGIAAMGQGDLARAETMFHRAIEQATDLAETHFNLGLLEFRRGRSERATQHFTTAVELRPNLTLGWFYLGEAASRLGKLDTALTHYRRALEIDPSHTRSYIGIASVLREKGETDEAIRFLQHGRSFADHPELVAGEK